MFNPRTFENSRPDGFPVLEVVEALDEQPTRPETRRFVPLQRTDLIGEIAGPVATFQLRQRFRFSSADFSKPIEAAYRFPLPGDAAVTGVRVLFGEVEIRAELAERASAEQTYKTAREEGRQAALLTREAPDVFTLQVAGLKPNEDAVIETHYAQLAHAEDQGWTLRVPLTTVPRFVRGDERGSAHAEGQPLAVLRDPGHRFSLDLTIEAAGSVTSPTHALDVAASEGRQRVRLQAGDVVPDRDCVLSWQPLQAEGRPTLQVLRDDESGDGASGSASHFLALVVPPARVAAGETLPREIVLLIDHSGSMSGPKWDASDWAVQNLLAGLTPDDTFNLGLFHNDTRWFARQPVHGDERTVRQAREFLLQHKDSGGTELGVALEQALGQPRDGGARARHVLIVTDAQVSDAGRILALVEREASRPDRRRVDVLCIDAAPNSGLANELAERGGGIARFLTSDPAENDIASALDEVLADWAAPVLRNLTLEVDRPSVQAAGRRVVNADDGHAAIDLGDLPAGRAVWVAGRIEGGHRRREGAPSFRLLADGREIAVDRPGAEEAAMRSASRPAVTALFGARRVLDLELAQSSGVNVTERLRQLGYDPDEVLARPDEASDAPLYPENARRQSTDALRDLLVRDSLRYGIACSATAFVATRREAGETVAGTVAVANALAHGWSEDFLMSRVAMGPPSHLGGYAAPIPFAAPMAAPPGAQPGSPAGSGSIDFGTMASAPVDLARGLARRIRGSGQSAGASGDYDSAGMPAQGDVELPTRAGSRGGLVTVFSGMPSFAGGEAVLFDSSTEPNRLPPSERLTRLVARLAGDIAPGTVDPEVAILLYVDDLTTPRARVRLADLLRQGGERPLNVRHRRGQTVRVVLVDPTASLGGRSLEVALG